jgi:CTP synthase
MLSSNGFIVSCILQSPDLILYRSADGILVPGGFGVRGVEGMVSAAKYARENKVPFLGVCLGMQVLVIEYARHVLGLKNANSTEFDESCTHPTIMFMPEINQRVMGGTMRLGARDTLVTLTLPSGAKSLAAELYGVTEDQEPVSERHRHRYEVNPEKVSALTAAGLCFTGKDDRGERMELVELPRTEHPFYFGAQFHPEFKSRPNRPSPPFFAFIALAAHASNDISRAGNMWRDYEDEMLRVAVVSSPSGRLKRAMSNVGIDLNDIKLRKVEPLKLEI